MGNGLRVASTRSAPADTAGRRAEEMRGRAQCTLVAGLAGKGSIARAARGVVCGAFLVRGGARLTGSTQCLVSWMPAPEFVRRDRRCYGSVCLGIGTAVATTFTRD